jgi:bacillithiol synthase
MFINFCELPGHQNIFLDYLYEYNSVKDYYPHNFRSAGSYSETFKKLAANEKPFAEELKNIVLNQYSTYSPSDKTRDNIRLLGKKKTITVVTGQQLGILGGPLYTIYKTLSAIKLCSHLSKEHPEYEFVPIFWLEGDDHDFEEIKSVGLLDDNNQLKTITYSDEEISEENSGSVGYLKIKSSINDFFDELDIHLKPTDFKPQLLSKLKEIYSEGKTFKQSFFELLFWFFDKYGLVIFDPQQNNVKELLKPIFLNEINNFRKHTELSVNISASLEEVYHAQVKVRPINLFYQTPEGRFLLEPVDNEYRLKGKRKKFTYQELIDMLDSDPSCFSANVLLRPICQDYLLNSGVYIAGPGEIAYFAQVNSLYPFFNVTPPIIFPRASVTIVEKHVAAIVEKYDIELAQIFIDLENLKFKILQSLTDIKLDDIFDKASHDIDLVMDSLKEKLFLVDKTISDSSVKYREKISHYLNELKNKAVEAQKKRYDITLKQVDKAAAFLYPDNSYQEREVSFINYANKYGIELIDTLYNEIDIKTFEHQFLFL